MNLHTGTGLLLDEQVELGFVDEDAFEYFALRDSHNHALRVRVRGFYRLS